MDEKTLIGMFAQVHAIKPFEADAEVVSLGGAHLLVTTDSFSEREDFLSGLEPEAIGRFMAHGAVSDILACGATPLAIVQAWNIDEAHGEDFYRRVACGIEQVAAHYGAKIVGGDIGTAKEWCWTATVFAECANPVRRVAARRVDFDLHATGLFGEANAAVFTGSALPVHALRDPVMPQALFATDSSGGFFDALENFRRVNSGMWLEIDARRAISPDVANFLPAGIEPGLSLVGGVGEYELVFAVPSGLPVANAVKIGRGGFRDTEECDFAIIDAGRRGRISCAPPDYRAIAREEWLAATVECWNGLWR